MLSPLILAAQGIGLVGMGLDLYASTFKDDRKLKTFIIIAGLIFAVHFALLNAWTAAISEIITAFRCFASLYWRSAKVSVPFMAAYGIAAIFTARGFIDWLPYLASLIGTYAMFHTQSLRMRLWFLGGQSLWFVYSAYHYSLGATILYTLLIFSTARTGIQLFKDQKALQAP